MKKYKSTRLIAGILASSLLLTNPIVVSAADGQTTGDAASTVIKTDKITYGKKLAKHSYVTVDKGHSVSLLKQSSNNKFKKNGKKAKNGATYSSYNKKTVGQKHYYYIGKGRWINSSNTIAYHLKHTRYHVLKNSPKSMEYYTSQYFPVFAPWGCASSSLSMLMKYDHTFNKVPGKTAKAKLTYMQNHLPRNKSKGGQDGNPYTGFGFTRVILASRLTKYAHQLGDKKIKNVSGISLNNIKKLVLGGHPVLYYGYSSYDAGGYRNHCKAIFGYSKKSNKFLVHDPLYQANKFYKGGGGKNAYDLGPISWVKASHINREFAYRGGNNALTTD